VKNKLFALLSVLVLASLMLAACGPAETTEAPMTEPPATEAPATEAPTAAPEPTPIPDVPIATFDGTSLSVPAEECNGDYAGLIQSVVATDANTVTFTLCRPDPAFLSKVAFSPFAIYPSEWLEATAADGARTSEGLEHPVGTGPYMVSEWKRGESITFVANPDYWGEPPAAETLVYRWSSESAARLLELQSGTVDGIDNVGPEDFETVQNDPNLHLQVRPALNVFYIAMTNTFEPFDDVKVRQAVAMGIDRQRIVDNFYPPGSEVASHFTPCAIPNGCVGDPWYDFDVDAAKALLAEAGFPDGFSTKLYYRDVVRGYLPQVSNVAQDIQAQLKENLNIDAEIVVMESGAFIEASTSGSLDGFYLLGWGADYPHITNFLDFHFGAANPQFGNQSPTYTDLLVQGAQIADPAEAEPIYVQANNAIREFVPMIPVAHGGSAAAYKADVTTPQASPLTNEQFAFSDPGGRDTFVWMQNAEPISMFCADESDGESLRACDQVMEALYGYEINGTATEPLLAESCDPNEDLTVWTCTLRQGVKFHDGSDFDATDVVATFNMGLNIASPTHAGNTNLWEYYDYLWGLMKKPGG
jgi:ABC-type transport system substrate-binding protein